MYYLVFVPLYLLSLLPFSVLYILSDIFYFLLYRVIRYRKVVVLDNLRFAFPEKTEEERKKIASQFYRNFVDNWIESIKLLSISKKSLNKRITANYDVLHDLFAKGRSVQANLGHFMNWEMMNRHTGVNQPFPFLPVYKPLTSHTMDRLMKYIRGKWGNPLISSTDLVKAILPWRKKQYVLGLGADQNTPFIDQAYWLYFLNRPAPFAKGPEKFARGRKIPVVMMNSTKLKRGHYHFDYFLLTDDPNVLPDGELLRQYVRHLEKNIREQPEIYLWSHKRWKHAWRPEFEDLWIDDVPSPTASEKNM